MKSFESYISEREIVRHLCKIRVKIAKSRSKKHLLHLLTASKKYNYHVSVEEPRNDFERYYSNLIFELSRILPPRKKWVRLGEQSRRRNSSSKEFLTSNDKNFYSLLKTIKLESKKANPAIWLCNLRQFVSNIQSIALDDKYQIDTPIVVPQPKNKKLKRDFNECRPICMFSLRDRIILSLTNKFLSQLFDQYFTDSSFAFRTKKNQDGKILSHHDCIKEILKYRNENINVPLYVMECDIKKFYDTVNHDIAKKTFSDFILLAKADNPELDLISPIRIFESYLDSYAFNVNAPASTNSDYWLSYKIPNGAFGWIEEDFSTHYAADTVERIGVPQGGALSGLIANLYLNRADVEMAALPILYQRFCDDMIVVYHNREDCDRAKNIYFKVLNDLKLFPHNPKSENELRKVEETDPVKFNFKPFWDGKSKGPYKWAEIKDNGFPWIGFVGYEINFNGNLRVRKKSLEKELAKQKQIVNEIKRAVKYEMRKPKGTATESAINRLIGMSVGRVGLDNFEEVSTDLCWKNGFRELNLNKDSLRQIKELDRNRNKHYYKLLKEVPNPDIEVENIERREVVKYNKPFSYYYQILERDLKANS